ncbi:MAG: addiction module protein [Planctomycetes bacterium]|nr:addiction module protein [Planctomycetota bacterium]
MTDAQRAVLEQALMLPPTQRAELVERLLESFGFADRRRLDALWATEVEDRLDSFDRGEMSALDAQDVFDEIDRSQGAWTSAFWPQPGSSSGLPGCT